MKKEKCNKMQSWEKIFFVGIILAFAGIFVCSISKELGGVMMIVSMPMFLIGGCGP